MEPAAAAARGRGPGAIANRKSSTIGAPLSTPASTRYRAHGRRRGGAPSRDARTLGPIFRRARAGRFGGRPAGACQTPARRPAGEGGRGAPSPTGALHACALCLKRPTRRRVAGGGTANPRHPAVARRAGAGAALLAPGSLPRRWTADDRGRPVWRPAGGCLPAGGRAWVPDKIKSGGAGRPTTVPWIRAASWHRQSPAG